MDMKLHEWLMSHQPEDKMLWKDAFWATYAFWQNDILPMFTDEYYKKNWDLDKLIVEINENSDIVGEHWSKSIIHPVMKIKYKDVTIVFRYNFYNYEIAVISDKPIKIPMAQLFDSKEASFCYEGFPEDYKVEDRYEDNKCCFIASVYNHYRFYAFMYLLERQIHINSKRKKDR